MLLGIRGEGIGANQTISKIQIKKPIDIKNKQKGHTEKREVNNKQQKTPEDEKNKDELNK